MSPMNQRLGGRAWLVTVAGVTIFLLAGLVPIPGVDQAALRELAGGGVPGLFNVPLPLVTVVGFDLAWLVVIRGALLAFAPAGPDDAARRHRLAFALYVGAAAVTGIAEAMRLEALSANGVPVVEVAGWSFRLLFALSLGGGSALVWIVASWIGREGIGRGTLVLVGAHTAPTLAVTVYVLLLLGGESFGRLPALVAIGLAPLIVFGALWDRSLTWPATLRGGLTALSPIDVVLAPWAAAHVARVVVHAVARSTPDGWLDVAGAVFATLAALGLVRWLRRAAPGPIVGSVSLAALASILIAGGITLQQSPRLLRQGPWDGPGTYEVTLSSADGKARDARRIAKRLDQLAVDTRVLDKRDGRIRLQVDHVRDPRDLMAEVLRQGPLSVQLVADDQTAVLRAGEAVGSLESVDAFDGYWVGPTREALAPLLARIELDAAHEARVECRREEGVRCTAIVLERRKILTGKDIASAQVMVDPAENMPYVALELTSEAAEVFERETARNVRRRLAIVVDGVIESAPVIKQAIPGGRLQITLGAFLSFAESLSRASALVAALSTGELSGEWRIERLREVR